MTGRSCVDVSAAVILEAEELMFESARLSSRLTLVLMQATPMPYECCSTAGSGSLSLFEFPDSITTSL